MRACVVLVCMMLALSAIGTNSRRLGHVRRETQAEAQERYPKSFAASPLLSGSEAEQLLDRRAHEVSGFSFREVEGPAAAGRRGLFISPTAVRPNHRVNRGAILAAITRECPQALCTRTQGCPFDGGICCASDGGGTCCPAGPTCLPTNPATCVTDRSDEATRCAEAMCTPGFHCPHQGIATCCLGGNLCCPHSTRCRATKPPSCERILNPLERQQHEQMEAKLTKDLERAAAAANGTSMAGMNNGGTGLSQVDAAAKAAAQKAASAHGSSAIASGSTSGSASGSSSHKGKAKKKKKSKPKKKKAKKKSKKKKKKKVIVSSEESSSESSSGSSSGSGSLVGSASQASSGSGSLSSSSNSATITLSI